MARPRSTESVRAYFRLIFDNHPDWLWSRSNGLVLEQWKKDHPGEEITAKVKDGMANIKSVKRREGRDDSPTTSMTRPGRSARTASLEQLEETIDSVLLKAREFDGEEMSSIVKYLRRARNRVVLELGEPGKD
jgi:hypothetical protein